MKPATEIPHAGESARSAPAEVNKGRGEGEALNVSKKKGLNYLKPFGKEWRHNSK